MTAYATYLHHDPSQGFDHDEEVSNQLYEDTQPGLSVAMLESDGAETPDDASFDLLPYLANVGLSAVSGTLAGALTGAASWGLAGAGFGFGGVAYVAAIKELALCFGGREELRGGNIAVLAQEPAVATLLLQFTAWGLVAGGQFGALYGSVSGLLNAQYQEYFDAGAQAALVGGVCDATDIY